MPVIPVPGGLRFQPVDSREVAARLVELTLDKPAGLVPDLAGPRIYPMADLVRGYLRAAHRRRLVVPVRMSTAYVPGMSPTPYSLRTEPAPLTAYCGRRDPVYGSPAASVTRNTTACEDEERGESKKS